MSDTSDTSEMSDKLAQDAPKLAPMEPRPPTWIERLSVLAPDASRDIGRPPEVVNVAQTELRHREPFESEAEAEPTQSRTKTHHLQCYSYIGPLNYPSLSRGVKSAPRLPCETPISNLAILRRKRRYISTRRKIACIEKGVFSSLAIHRTTIY